MRERFTLILDSLEIVEISDARIKANAFYVYCTS